MILFVSKRRFFSQTKMRRSNLYRIDRYIPVETKKNKQGVGVKSQESVVPNDSIMAASMHQRWEGLSIKKGPKKR